MYGQMSHTLKVIMIIIIIIIILIIIIIIVVIVIIIIIIVIIIIIIITIIKTPFYLLKINKTTSKKYLCNALLLTCLYL